MDDHRRDILFKCFCEARRSQAFFTKCLEKEITEEEREFLFKLIEESAKTSCKILQSCIKLSSK